MIPVFCTYYSALKCTMRFLFLTMLLARLRFYRHTPTWVHAIVSCELSIPCNFWDLNPPCLQVVLAYGYFADQCCLSSRRRNVHRTPPCSRRTRDIDILIFS